MRTRLVSRENCQAKIVFQRIADGKYWIYKFVKYHCHILASPILKLGDGIFKIVYEILSHTMIGFVDIQIQ